MDIQFINIIQIFYRCNILRYLKTINERFTKRKNFWVCDDDMKLNKYLEDLFVNIDRWSFSSQYYYMVTVGCFGGVYILMGLITIIYHQYNVFQDINSIIIVILWVLLCLLVYLIFKYICLATKLWQVKRKNEEVKQSSLAPMNSEQKNWSQQ